MRRLLFVSFLLFGLVAVGSPATAQKRGDRSLITRQDLDEGGTGITTAFDAVQRLRPNWLRPPMGRSATAGLTGGGENATEPIVYIDDRRQPNLESLRTIPAATLKELKYLDQNRAVQMLGPGHEAGAIQVFTTRGRT